MIVGFFLTFWGTALIVLSMKRLYRLLFVGQNRTENQKIGFRIAGYLGLAAGAYACVGATSFGMGLVWFTAFLNVAVFSLAMVLAWRGNPKRVRA